MRIFLILLHLLHAISRETHFLPLTAGSLFWPSLPIPIFIFWTTFQAGKRIVDVLDKDLPLRVRFWPREWERMYPSFFSPKKTKKRRL